MFGWFRKLRDDGATPPSDRSPPISHRDLKGLFEYLDRPNPPPCQHDHRETAQFLTDRKLPVDSTIAWLKANGGYCDCEVIFNVTDEWGDEVGWMPTEEE